MSDYQTPSDDRATEESLSVETAEYPTGPVSDEAWDVFELDEDTIEPEPAYGDFWGELDDDEMI